MHSENQKSTNKLLVSFDFCKLKLCLLAKKVNFELCFLETTVSVESGMNPVIMTIIYPLKELLQGIN